MMLKKVKIYFSNSKKPKFNRITQASALFFNTRLKNKDIDTKKGGISSYFDNKINSTIYVCIGEEIDNDLLQETGAKAIKTANNMHTGHDININLVFDNSLSRQQRLFIEKGALLALQKDDEFKSSLENNKEDTKNKTNNKDNSKQETTIKGILHKNLIAITDGIKHARELTFKPANIITPDSIEQYIKTIMGTDKNITIKTLDKSALQKEDMNLFLAVGQGSSLDPKMVIMEYTPASSKDSISSVPNIDPIVLVGKGLTYDSGGLYAKPYPHMNEMFGDMGGAATVVGIMSALSELKINKHIIGIIGLAENMPDGAAYKNGDIIKSKSGKTVYVGHTDAEGRLVLADMLSYAKENYKASLTLDFATLTGACPCAVGEMYTAIFSDNQNLITKLNKTGITTNDLTRQLPLDKETKKAVKHNLADLSNTGNLKGILGASTAASFLSNFVQDTNKWIHCDIAGSALRTQMKKSYDLPNGIGTGAMVHTVLEYLK